MFHKLSKKYPRLPEFLSSHPKPKRRIKEAKKYVAKLPEAHKRKLHRLSFKTGTKYFFKRYDAYKKYDKAMQKFVNKKYNEAIKFINEAIKIHKDDSSFYTLKGQIYFATQKYKLAGKSLRKALKINRKNIFANLTYGHLLFHKRRFNLSEKYFGTALNINPSNIEARFYLAESLFLQDKKTDAKPHYQTIVIFAERHGYKKGSDLEYYYIKSRKRLRQIG
jgi:predicted Zn-dependent protease